MDAETTAGETQVTPDLNLPGHGRLLASVGSMTRRSQLTGDWNNLLAEIRAAGFDRFLLPPTPEQVLTDAGDGPVVVLNVSRHRSHALVIRNGTARAVRLPAITLDSVADRITPFFLAVNTALDVSAELPARHEAEDTITGTLQWLWDGVAEPILDHLAMPTLAPGRRPPRLWWIPAGPMSFLPIHAAGRPGTRGATPATMLDHVMCSYAPTVRALARSRRGKGPTTRQPRTLVAALPETPGAPDLSAAAFEARLIARLTSGELLVGDQATRRHVLAQLVRHDRFHFAGHAVSDLADPSNSHLLLHDQPLTVHDLSHLGLDSPDIAFLSACATVQPGVTAMDEAISIASACQLAGYRHVIASLWEVDDEVAAEVAGHIWQSITATRAEDTSAAVHDAVVKLREKFPGNPSLWAAFVHIGP
jgi:hypothetical protein